MAEVESAQLKIGEAAPSLRAEGPDGEAVELARWWQRTPLVLIYLRHFG